MRGQCHAPAAPYPGKDPVPIVKEAGWAPGPVCTGAENLAPPGFDSRTVHPVGSRYTDYATRPTISKNNIALIFKGLEFGGLLILEDKKKSFEKAGITNRFFRRNKVILPRNESVICVKRL